jgi:hypothetical protein
LANLLGKTAQVFLAAAAPADRFGMANVEFHNVSCPKYMPEQAYAQRFLVAAFIQFNQVVFNRKILV